VLDVIYEEAASGKSAARPELEQCRKAFRAGDTLVVWRLDRLGRSLPDLVQIVAELEQRGVHFESLTEKIETGSAAGKLQFHVFAALAEFERGLIRERTQAGWQRPVPEAGPVAAKPNWTKSRYARSRRFCAIPTFRWRTWRGAMACPEPPYTSMSGPSLQGGRVDDQKRKNPPTWAGFFVLSYVLGGRLAPASPVASDLNIRLPGGYVKQPENDH
jgi:hypothetical protein